MLRRARAVLVILILCWAVVSCSTGSAPSGQPSAPQTVAPSASPSAPSSTAQRDLVRTAELGAGPELVWREDINYDKGPVNNEDLTLPPGSYELQTVCSSITEVRVSVDKGPFQPLDCLRARAPGLKICTVKPGLFLTLARVPGVDTDLVWGLKKTAPRTCQTPSTTGGPSQTSTPDRG